PRHQISRTEQPQRLDRVGGVRPLQPDVRLPDVVPCRLAEGVVAERVVQPADVGGPHGVAGSVGEGGFGGPDRRHDTRWYCAGRGAIGDHPRGKGRSEHQRSRMIGAVWESPSRVGVFGDECTAKPPMSTAGSAPGLAITPDHMATAPNPMNWPSIGRPERTVTLPAFPAGLWIPSV